MIRDVKVKLLYSIQVEFQWTVKFKTSWAPLSEITSHQNMNRVKWTLLLTNALRRNLPIASLRLLEHINAIKQ
jgi:hypothetical protein